MAAWKTCLLNIIILSIYGVESTSSISENASMSRGSLPDIRAGQSCVPGMSYRMDCNTCTCNYDKRLMCSKMACVNPIRIFNVINQRKKKMLRLRKSQDWSLFTTEQAVNERTVDTQFEKQKQRSGEKYPELAGKKCVPGKLYRKGCQRCFCDDQKFIMCSNTTCEKLREPVRVPEDVGPLISAEVYDSLPTLEHEAAECEPGKTYKVDCNACRCLYNKNLLCTRMLCLSPDEVNRIEATKLSGKPCQNYVNDECLQCICANGKQNCKPVTGCMPRPLQKQLRALRVSSPEQLRIDISDENVKCIPGMVYKLKCNNCYCQDDMSLRCTRKGCLNYTQIKKLEKQREKLFSGEDKTFRVGAEPDEEKNIIKKIKTGVAALEKLARDIEDYDQEKTVAMEKTITPHYF